MNASVAKSVVLSYRLTRLTGVENFGNNFHCIRFHLAKAEQHTAGMCPSDKLKKPAIHLWTSGTEGDARMLNQLQLLLGVASNHPF